MKQRLQALLLRFRTWLDGLETRERRLVLTGLVVVMLTLLYLIIWEPAVKKHQRRETEISAARELAQRIETLATKSQGTSQRAGHSRGLSLLVAVDQASKSGALGKPPSRIQPEGDAEVKIWFDAVSFEALMRWLAQLQSQEGIVAQTVQIERSQTSGMVSAQLSLVRP